MATQDTMPDRYPTRDKFFAFRFCRLLAKTASAQELGPDVCWLLTVIAMQEDAKRYKGAVTYYNDQLAPLCGFSEKSLMRARNTAIDSGWLHYTAGGNRKAGRYWCLIPNHLDDIPDTQMDESAESSTDKFTVEREVELSSVVKFAVERAVELLSSTDKFTVEPSSVVKFTVEREVERQLNGISSYPYPNPIPKEESLSPPSAAQTAPKDDSPDGPGFDESDRPDNAALRADAAELLIMWQNLDGVRPYPYPELSRHLQERLRDARNWREALTRFPLPCCRDGPEGTWKPDLTWFLEPGNIEKVLSGRYDFQPDAKRRAGKSRKTYAKFDGNQPTGEF